MSLPCLSVSSTIYSFCSTLWLSPLQAHCSLLCEWTPAVFPAFNEWSTWKKQRRAEEGGGYHRSVPPLWWRHLWAIPQENQLFALISHAIHPPATHIFTLFLTTFKRNKCLSSIPWNTQFFKYSLLSPLSTPQPISVSVRACVCVCVLLQLWAFFFAVLSLSTLEVICSRGLSYNAHIKKFLQDAARARALVLYGSKSAGEFLHRSALT